MKIAIVGGGITGLTTGYFLSKKGHQITLFEKSDQLGGLASSFKNTSWEWPLERFYHHFFVSDKDFLSLSKELKIENNLFFKNPKTSVFVDGEILRFDNPQSLLAFPKLNPLERLRTGVASLLLKFNPFWKPLEKISSFDLIPIIMGKKSFELLWKPLLVGKFGNSSKEVPASWFWTRMNKRSFKLGYLNRGFFSLVSTLTEQILQKSGQILTNHEITKIEYQKSGKKFKLWLNNKNFPQEFDCVIATLPPSALSRIVNGLTKEEKTSLRNYQNLGSLCLIFELKSPFLKDGTYWLNVNNENFPFVAVVEHTNFIDKKHYNNQTVVYVGGYYTSENPVFRAKKEQIIKMFTPYLKKINPHFDPQTQISNSWLFKEVYAQPIVSLNYSQKTPGVKTSLPGLYWASLHHVYPQDRGINYAIALGKKIADEIKNLKKN